MCRCCANIALHAHQSCGRAPAWTNKSEPEASAAHLLRVLRVQNDVGRHGWCIPLVHTMLGQHSLADSCFAPDSSSQLIQQLPAQRMLVVVSAVGCCVLQALLVM